MPYGWRKPMQSTTEGKIAASCPTHTQALLEESIERGHVLKATVAWLIPDSYGRETLHDALGEALTKQAPYPAAVQQILEQRRDAQQRPTPISVTSSEPLRRYTSAPPNLKIYDSLNTSQELEEEDHDERRPILWIDVITGMGGQRTQITLTGTPFG